MLKKAVYFITSTTAALAASLKVTSVMCISFPSSERTQKGELFHQKPQLTYQTYYSGFSLTIRCLINSTCLPNDPRWQSWTNYCQIAEFGHLKLKSTVPKLLKTVTNNFKISNPAEHTGLLTFRCVFLLTCCFEESSTSVAYLLSLFLCQFVVDVIFDCRPGALVNYGIPEGHL